MNSNMNKLINKLGNEIYDIEKIKKSNMKLEELEKIKYYKEKDILLKIRELEILQSIIVQNYSIDNLIKLIEDKAKNEYIDIDNYKEEKLNIKKTKNNENFHDKPFKSLINIKYMLFEYLHKDDLKFVKNLLEKALNAYNNKNYKFLYFYEDLSLQIFEDGISNGKINEENLTASIKKIQQEKKELEINENKEEETLINDTKKLNELLNEIDEMFLMSIPEKNNDYVM